MKTLLSDLINSRFVRNVFTVAGGSVGAQLIVLSFAPVITRLYGPEAFGVLGIFVATTALVNTIGSLTYQIGIVLPEDDVEAVAVASVSVHVLLVVSVFLFGVIYVFKEPIVSLLQIEAIYHYLFLIPVFVFFSGLHKIVEQWIIRKEDFSLKAKIGVANAFIVNSVKTGIGLFNPMAVVLILLATLGEVLHATLLTWGRLRKRLREIRSTRSVWFDYRLLRDVFFRYRDFPLYRAPQALIGAIGKNTPVLILASFFGPVAAGYYALGNRTVMAPIGIISASVGKVFFPRIAKAFNNDEDVQNLLIKATIGLSAVGIAPFGAVILFGPSIFGVIFGSEWIVAGEYARWLSVWLYGQFVRTATTQTIPVIGMQRTFLWYTIISTVISISSLILAVNILKNDIDSLAVFCVINGLFNGILIFYVIYRSREKFKLADVRSGLGRFE